MAKGLRKPIVRSMHTRADKKLQRVFVDLSGPMAVQSIGGKRYTLIVRDDCTRFTRVFFIFIFIFFQMVHRGLSFRVCTLVS